MIERIKNLYYYIEDMSKYNFQCFLEKKEQVKTGKDFVLMFHCVSNKVDEWDDSEYSILSDSFKKMIDRLEEEKYVFSTPEDFLKKKGTKKILITFDDAYRCVYTEVFPYLKEKHIPFIVFQTVSFLNQDKYLDENMIKEMLKYELFFLGTHTISHCNLHKCKNYKKEILEPAKIFKEKFGIAPYYFAYPYGAYVTLDLKHILCAKKAYKVAFSTCNMSYDKLRCRYLVPRININESNWLFFASSNLGMK